MGEIVERNIQNVSIFAKTMDNIKHKISYNIQAVIEDKFSDQSLENLRMNY